MRHHDKEVIIADGNETWNWTEMFIQAMKENKIFRIIPIFKKDIFYLEAEKRIMLDEPIIRFSVVNAKDGMTIASLHADNFTKISPVSYFTALNQIGWEYGDESLLDPKFNELF